MEISKIVLKGEIGVMLDESYIEKEVYLVYFGTHSPGTPNNLPVFISIDNEKLIGYGVIE